MEPTIDLKSHVAKGTGFHAAIGWLVFIFIGPFVVLATIVVTYGIALLVWLVVAVQRIMRAKKARAQLRGSAVRVDATQFPEIHQAAVGMADRLGLKQCPDIYIIEDNQQNAAALKHGSTQYVILIDDIVFGAMATGNQRIIDFVVAHELAHHALGHTGTLRSRVSQFYRPLSRLDEFSCDAVAAALIDDRAAAQDALVLLLIGPQLFAQVDRTALHEQALEVEADKYTKKAESGQHHPLLLHRYAALESDRP